MTDKALYNWTAPRKGGRSPWGTIQTVDTIAPGIWSVSTASHGGIKLSPSRSARMPEALRVEGCNGWYEEDCDWARVFCAFESEIVAEGDPYAVKTIASGQHRETLRNWAPHAFRAMYPGEPCTVENSYTLSRELQDQRAAEMKAQGKAVRYSAIGVGDRIVKVSFIDANKLVIDWYMDQDTYHAIPYGTAATVADYRAHGPVWFDNHAHQVA